MIESVEGEPPVQESRSLVPGRVKSIPYEFDMCCFLAWCSGLIWYGKDWLAEYRNNVGKPSSDIVFRKRSFHKYVYKLEWRVFFQNIYNLGIGIANPFLWNGACGVLEKSSPYIYIYIYRQFVITWPSLIYVYIYKAIQWKCVFMCSHTHTFIYIVQPSRVVKLESGWRVV